MAHLLDIHNRLSAMEQEALNALSGVTVDTVLWPGFKATFPYFVNRYAGFNADSDYSEDLHNRPYRWEVLLVVDHVTAGWEGEVSENVLDYIVTFDDYMLAHPALTTNGTTYGDYTAEPGYLFDEVRVISHAGQIGVQNSGIGVLQLGCRFVYEVPFIREGE